MSGLSYAFGTPPYNPTWWYMSLAIILLVIIPVFIRTYEKIGYSIIILAVLVPRLIWPGINDAELSVFIRYLPVVALGICASKDDWFEKMNTGGGGYTAVRLWQAELFFRL